MTQLIIPDPGTELTQAEYVADFNAVEAVVNGGLQDDNIASNANIDLEKLGATRTTAIAFSGGMTVANSGGIGIALSDGMTVATGGITITAGGLDINGGGATITGGLTIDDVGLTVTAGGAIITAGGLTITAGGITLTAGGLDIASGNAVDVRGVNGIDYNTGGSDADVDIFTVQVTGTPRGYWDESDDNINTTADTQIRKSAPIHGFDDTVTDGRRAWMGLRAINTFDIRTNESAIGTQQDVSQPSWLIALHGGAADDFKIRRKPAGGSYSTVMLIDSNGRMVSRGLTPRIHLEETDPSGESGLFGFLNVNDLQIRSNSTDAGAIQDSSVPQWAVSIHGGGSDLFRIARAPVSGALASLLTLDNSGNLVLDTGNITLTAGGATIDGVDVGAHDTATTGVHGMGGNTIASTADITTDIATHNGLGGVHGGFLAEGVNDRRTFSSLTGGVWNKITVTSAMVPNLDTEVVLIAAYTSDTLEAVTTAKKYMTGGTGITRSSSVYNGLASSYVVKYTESTDTDLSFDIWAAAGVTSIEVDMWFTYNH